MEKKIILLVEDEELNEFTKMLKDDYEVIGKESADAALEVLQEKDIDLILCNLRMKPNDGMWLLDKVKKQGIDIPFVMITRYGTSAEEAAVVFKAGAVDYITKPILEDDLILRLSHALEHDRTIRYFVQSEEERYKIADGTIQDIIQEIMKVAPYNTTVLITGESGTGKESVARGIHKNSPRRKKLFVPVNCAGIPSEIIESELFGHEKGAFTGAVARRIGKFEQANGGTIFLDEVGDMSLAVQAKVLRFLEEREFERIGGKETIRVDVRIISATNKTLQEEISAGNFREDLFYRLKGYPIRVPPLRERTWEIPLLARHFIDKFCYEQKKPKKEITPEAMKFLILYSWPGNVRELRNYMERLVIQTEDYPTIQEYDIWPIIISESNTNSSDEQSDSLDEAEKGSINQIELGKRLKYARDDFGLTQEEVAKALNLHRPAISQIESGKRKVNSLELARLARLYKKQISDLLQP